jgi:histidyl-tRNA synthetase
MKRYCFDKIYKLHPSLNTKSFCSFDIVGSSPNLIQEVEILKIASEITTKLRPKVGKWLIRVIVNSSETFRLIILIF